MAESMLAWLRSERVVLPGGAVRSWDSPTRPGYLYPEAAALLLGLLAREDPGSGLGDRIAGSLAQATSDSGGIGRNGARYAFDTAIALSGLLAHRAAGGRIGTSELPARLFAFLADRLEARAPVDGDAGAPPDHWSATYGSHLLKSAIALETYGALAPEPRAGKLVDQLLADFLPLCVDGRFVTRAGAKITYLHGACYAIEGLLWLRDRGRSELEATVRAAAAWLARVQAEEGGLRAWHDGKAGWGERHADVAAQAIRIWTAVDRRAYDTPIRETLHYLAELQTTEGGLRYHLSSSDVNTWCTLFALQASRWAARGADVPRLV